MVTGRDSHTTLERIGRLEHLAADPSQPESVRIRAAEEVERIKAGGSVYPSHLRINAELFLAELEQIAADATRPAELREQARTEAAAVRDAEREARAAELDELAQAALARVKAAKKTGRKPRRPALTAVETQGEPVPFPLTVFVAVWDDLAEWWLHHDPDEVGRALTEEQWSRFGQPWRAPSPSLTPPVPPAVPRSAASTSPDPAMFPGAGCAPSWRPLTCRLLGRPTWTPPPLLIAVAAVC